MKSLRILGRRFAGLLLIGLLLIGGLAGCGGGAAAPYVPPLDGVLAWEDGTSPLELEGGSVEFESQGKTVATTGLRPDGTFTLAEALPAGDYRIRVLPPPANLGKPAVLDPRYESFDKSGLKFTASAGGTQHAEFKLTRKRR